MVCQVVYTECQLFTPNVRLFTPNVRLFTQYVRLFTPCARFVKKETREFFGLDEGSEATQRQRWEEKRRRLAARKYGQLKENSTSLSASLSASAAAGFGTGFGGRLVPPALNSRVSDTVCTKLPCE